MILVSKFDAARASFLLKSDCHRRLCCAFALGKIYSKTDIATSDKTSYQLLTYPFCLFPSLSRALYRQAKPYAFNFLIKIL
jgi:hypothetical protein